MAVKLWLDLHFSVKVLCTLQNHLTLLKACNAKTLHKNPMLCICLENNNQFLILNSNKSYLEENDRYKYRLV